MHRLHGQFEWLRLGVVLAGLGQLPIAASADPLFPGSSPVPLERSWIAPLAPSDAVPGDSGETLSLVSTDEFSGELFVSGVRSPGLDFSLNPVDEEILLGWRFAF